MINQLMLHAEKRSEIHLRMVGHVDSTGLITPERDGYIGERCGVSPPVRLRFVLVDGFRIQWRSSQYRTGGGAPLTNGQFLEPLRGRAHKSL